MKKLALTIAAIFAVSAMAFAADNESEHKDTTDKSKNVLTGKTTVTKKHTGKMKRGGKEVKKESKETETMPKSDGQKD